MQMPRWLATSAALRDSACTQTLAAAASLSQLQDAARSFRSTPTSSQSELQRGARSVHTTGARAQEAQRAPLDIAMPAAPPPPMSLSGLQRATEACTAASAVTLVQQCQQVVQRRMRSSAQIIAGELPALARLHDGGLLDDAATSSCWRDCESLVGLYAGLPALPGLQQTSALRLNRNEAAALTQVRRQRSLHGSLQGCVKIRPFCLFHALCIDISAAH